MTTNRPLPLFLLVRLTLALESGLIDLGATDTALLALTNDRDWVPAARLWLDAQANWAAAENEARQWAAIGEHNESRGGY